MVRVEPSDAYGWVFFHEIGHHPRRKHLPLRNEIIRPLSISDRVEMLEEEAMANKIAEDLFYRWRITRNC